MRATFPAACAAGHRLAITTTAPETTKARRSMELTSPNIRDQQCNRRGQGYLAFTSRWQLSGHERLNSLEHKRSGSPRIADIRAAALLRRFVPGADSCVAANGTASSAVHWCIRVEVKVTDLV